MSNESVSGYGKRPWSSPSGSTPKQVEKKQQLMPSATCPPISRRQLFFGQSQHQLTSEAQLAVPVITAAKSHSKWTPEDNVLLAQFINSNKDKIEHQTNKEWPQVRNQTYWSMAASYVNKNSTNVLSQKEGENVQ